jgi:glutamate racemase
MVHRYLNRFRAAGVDAIVLGCTHFLFLEDDFRQEAAPDITVFESVEGISRRIESLLGEISQQEEAVAAVENRLLLTGSAAPEPLWTAWAARLGFELSLLEEA